METDCQELQEIIEHMNKRPKERLTTIERTQELMSVREKGEMDDIMKE